MNGPQTEKSRSQSNGSGPSRWHRLLRSPFFWGAIVGVVAIPLLRPLLRHIPEPPPVLGTVPPFALTDQDGRPFGLDALSGRTWIANFFFSTCPSVCPKLMKATARLVERFAQGNVPVQIVSITVDPENDTPERLKAYGRLYGVDGQRWRMLTGSRAAIEDLIVGGFRTHMGRKEPIVSALPNLVDIAHSTHFVLIDTDGRIRGFYGSDEEGLDETFHRAEQVARETSR